MGSPYDVVVIGAGAAGFFAATRAALRGRRTLLIEKNRKPGVKILMSGGTRCNLTHAADPRDIVAAFGKQQGPFLHSALAALSPDDLVAMFNAEGVATKIEPGGKVFPVSDRALDVLAALRQMFDRSGAELRLAIPVVDVRRDGNGFRLTAEREEIAATKLILTTGGQSYPGCGTTGDGYAWARALGHRIVQPRPALVPLTSPEPWLAPLSGVTLPDVSVEITSSEPGRPGPGASRRGSFLFTHFGLSGPVVMDLSRVVTERPQATEWRLICDFLPSIPEDKLLERISNESTGAGKRNVITLAAELVPRRLAEAVLARVAIPADRRLAELSRPQRQKLVQALKATPIAINGSLGFKKAEVTAGGVSLDEVDSRTMQSKLVPNLYLAGEILDLDGPIGGYNFQAAFSTGYLAGESV